MNFRRIAGILTFSVACLCLSLPAHADRLYWSRNVGDTVPGVVGYIDSARNDGSDLVGLLELQDVLVGSIDVDSQGRRLYWAEADVVNDRSFLARGGSSRCDRLELEGGFPRIAVDSAGGKIYWTESGITNGNGFLKRANLDFSSVEVLLSGLSQPADIGVDSPRGKIYWYDGVDENIKRANLDGSDVEVQFSVEFLRAMQVDPIEQKIYWTQIIPDGFFRADYDGSNQEPLAPQVVNTFAVDVTAGKVYWREAGGFDQPPAEINRADLDGSNEENLLTGLRAEASFLVLDENDQAITLGCGPAVPALGLTGAALLALLLLTAGTRAVTRR